MLNVSEKSHETNPILVLKLNFFGLVAEKVLENVCMEVKETIKTAVGDIQSTFAQLLCNRNTNSFKLLTLVAMCCEISTEIHIKFRLDKSALALSL